MSKLNCLYLHNHKKRIFLLIILFIATITFWYSNIFENSIETVFVNIVEQPFPNNKIIFNNQPIPPSGNITVISATYYSFSTLYQKNTIVLLFNGHRNLSRKQVWFCETRNKEGENLISPIKPLDALTQVPFCQAQAYASDCLTVLNPTYFALLPSENSKVSVQLQIRAALSGSYYPLVSCISPLFFNEKWHVNILSIELYSYLGVSKQIYYYMSVVGNGFKLLQEYEKVGIINLHPWIVPDSDNGLLRKELAWRNQETGLTDCYLNYREVAEFIMIYDPDDILIPSSSKNEGHIFNLVSNLFRLHSNLASLIFYRYNAEILSNEKLEDFDIFLLLNSTRITNKRVGQKSIHRTSSVYTIGAHLGVNRKEGFKQIEVKEENGIFIHARNLTFINNNYNNNITINNNTLDQQKDDLVDDDPHPLFKTLANMMKLEEFEIIKNIFSRRLFMNDINLLSNLSVTNYYYDIIDQCYEKMFYVHDPNLVDGRLCPSHFYCTIPPIENVICYQAEQQFSKHQIDNLIIYAGIDSPYTTVKKNGCTL